MNNISVKIKSGKFNCYFELERRITYIRGDSGVGKTAIIDAIKSYYRDEGLYDIECERDLYVLEDPRMIKSVDTFKNGIVFIDDNIVSEVPKYSNKFIELAVYYNIYFVIINRVDTDNAIKGKEGGKLKADYSASSILICKKNGVNKEIVKAFTEFETGISLSETIYDCIIVEDMRGMNDFCKGILKSGDKEVDFSRLFKIPVVSSDGRDTAIEKLKELVAKGYKSILMFVDIALFGRHWNSFVNYCYTLGDKVKVRLDQNYESFEYLLLMSNMLRNDFKFNQDRANSRYSWENYFEREIEKLTMGTDWEYKHKKEVGHCYIESCDKCDKECIKRIDGNKVKGLFEATDFDYLIDFQNMYCTDGKYGY